MVLESSWASLSLISILWSRRKLQQLPNRGALRAILHQVYDSVFGFLFDGYVVALCPSGTALRDTSGSHIECSSSSQCPRSHTCHSGVCCPSAGMTISLSIPNHTSSGTICNQPLSPGSPCSAQTVQRFWYLILLVLLGYDFPYIYLQVQCSYSFLPALRFHWMRWKFEQFPISAWMQCFLCEDWRWKTSWTMMKSVVIQRNQSVQ